MSVKEELENARLIEAAIAFVRDYGRTVREDTEPNPIRESQQHYLGIDQGVVRTNPRG